MVFDLFLESIQDNLDLFGHRAIEAEGEERLKHSRYFQEYYELLPERGKQKYGRVYTRLCLLRATIDLTVGLLLMDPIFDKEQSLVKEFDIKRLDQWSSSDWKKSKRRLGELLEMILKKGAVAGINEPFDETLCEERAASGIYNTRRITKRLLICEVLAPLRSALKGQLSDTRRSGAPQVSQDILTNFRKNAEDSNLLNVFRVLVVEDETNGGLKLKDIHEVRTVLESDQLSVVRTATKTLEKLKSWSKDLFEKPPISRLYEDNEEEVPELAQETLESSPNSPIRKRKRQGSGLFERGGSATQIISIPDDDDRKGEDKHEEDLRPMRKKVNEPQKETYKGRRAWTDQELEAVKQGVRVLGPGKWAEIKRMYPILNDRTSVQIKDCYRSLVKRMKQARLSR